MPKLKDKVILVSGASGGIGAAVAERCSHEGARVVVGYSTGAAKAQALCERIQASGGAASTLSLDLRDAGAIQRAVESAVKDHGRIDGLVNCSGLHVAGPLMGLKEKDVRTQIDVNLAGAILLAQAVLPAMVKQRSGSLVMIGSVAAHRMVRGHSVYSATKAGLEGFARALAAEVAKRQIRVNCILPGPVLTAMLEKSIQETGDKPEERVPIGRLIQADEVARAAVYLLSDSAAAITGASLPVDGGYLLW